MAVIETFGQEVVHALEQTGKTEFVVKEIDEIVRLELLSIRTCHNDSEPLLAAEGLGISFKVHGEAPIGAEQYPGSGIARDLLHAAEQNILYFFCRLCPSASCLPQRVLCGFFPCLFP